MGISKKNQLVARKGKKQTKKAKNINILQNVSVNLLFTLDFKVGLACVKNIVNSVLSFVGVRNLLRAFVSCCVTYHSSLHLD